MITRQEFTDYLVKKYYEMSQIEDYYIYDCGKDLNLSRDILRIAQKSSSHSEVRVYFENYNEILTCKEDVSLFVKKIWRNISKIFNLCEDKYYKTRWDLCVGRGPYDTTIEFDTGYNNCANIYTQITGFGVYGRHVSLEDPVKRIGEIDDQRWKIGEILMKKYIYTRNTPVMNIQKTENGIEINKRPQIPYNEMDNIGKMLFKDQDKYIIKDDEVDQFITTLQLVVG